MLTTDIDGIWVLQVLSRNEVLAPELGLRPYLPSVETARMALEHPVAARLREVGAIDTTGGVDETLLEWLSVLSRRDSALLLYAQHPSSDRGYQRVLLARFAQWWVRLERCESTVRLSDVGIATSEQSVATLISVQIESLCSPMAPAAFRPVAIDIDEMLQSVGEGASLRRFLTDCNFDGDQISTLVSAADTYSAKQASFVALKSDRTSPSSRSSIESGVVTVVDTPSGRLVCEHVVSDGRRWMIVSPGSTGDVASAVLKIMRCLPPEDIRLSRRKAV